MDVAGLFAFIRGQVQKKSTAQIVDADLLIYLNIAYHLAEDMIVAEVGEDFFYDYFYANLVSGQNEYTLPPSSATVEGSKKILSVEAKRSSNNAYCSLLDYQKNTEQWLALDELAAKTPTDAWFYDIKASSIFLYPTPTASVIGGLKLQAIVNLIDLTVNGAETDIFPHHTELRNWHWVIGMGAIPFVFKHFQQKADAAEAEGDFKNAMTDMIAALQGRKATTVEWSLPNWSYFKY